MKTVFTLMAALAVIVACSNDDDVATENASVLGRWKLTAMLADPGDGSGTFSPASGREIQFNADGTYVANSDSFCYFSSEFSLLTTVGNYNDTGIICNSNSGGTYDLLYTVEGNEMIITYPCFEPCRARYERVE
jgi:hypothetical protein